MKNSIEGDLFVAPKPQKLKICLLSASCMNEYPSVSILLGSIDKKEITNLICKSQHNRWP